MPTSRANPAPDNPSPLRVQMARTAGLFSLLVGLVVLLGWFLDLPRFKSLIPGLATMKANTALGFVLSGVALWTLVRFPPDPPIWRRLGIAASLAVALLGLLTLIQHLAGIDLGIDQLLFRDVPGSVGVSAPGRMASATATLFFLVGVTLVMLYADVSARFTHLWATLVLVVSAFPAIGYLYGVESLYAVAPFSSVALHTAVTLLVLALGLVAAGPRRGLVALLEDDGMAGMLIRRLLPATILVPLFLGWLRVAGQRAGWYGTEFGTATYALSNIVVFTFLVCWNASVLGRMDTVRQQTEDRFRAVVEHAPSGMVMVTQEGTIVLINGQMERMFGYTGEELIGQPVEQLIPSRARTEHPDLRTRYFSGPVPRVMGSGRDLAGLHKDGSEFAVEIGLQPIQLEGKLFVLASVIDVSQRKRTEEALRSSEDRLRRSLEFNGAVVNNMGEGLYTVDTRGLVTYVNPAAERLFGWSSEELLGSRMHEVTHHHHPDGRPFPASECAGLQVLQKGTVLTNHEDVFIRKDGTFFPVTYSASTLTENGTTIGLVVVFRDDSQRRKAREELRLSRERLDFVLRETGIGLWLNALPLGQLNWDDRTRQLFFVPPGTEPTIDLFWSRIHPEDREPTRQAVEVALRDRVLYAIDHRAIDPATGEVRWIRSMGQGSYESDGRAVRFDGINYDITDRKKAEEALRSAHDELEGKVEQRTVQLTEANRRLQESLEDKEVLLKEVHHRVKNNLQVISSLLQLQAQHARNPDVAPLFQESRNRVRSMALVHERLYQSNDLARIDFADYLRGLVASLFRTYQVDQSRVEFDLQTDVVHLEVDAAVPCGLAVNELITNCLKYAFPVDRSGVVRVRLSQTDGMVVIQVADDGVGIPQHVDLSNPRTFGLRLVTDLVDQLQGTLQMERQGGTDVRITFPVTRNKAGRGVVR